MKSGRTPDSGSFGDLLNENIAVAQRRLILAMEARLPTMPEQQKERYFLVLTNLVSKLEDPQKSLRDVLREVMTESAHLVLAELNEF